MRYLFLIVAIFFSSTSFATHLIGNELYYTYIGNDEYQITVRQFLQTGDLQGNQYTIADNEIIVVIYDGSGNLAQSLTIQQGNIQSVDNFKIDPCTGAVRDMIGIDFVDFTETVTLPPIAGGYEITY